MSYPFPPELDRLIREQLARGGYASEDDLLLQAVLALRDRDAVVAAVAEGLGDLDAGRLRPLSKVDAELRGKYNIPQGA